MKKILLILGLVFVIILTFNNSIYATNSENISKEADYVVAYDDSHHMQQHRNADIHERFNTYAPVIMTILLIINSIIFCVMSKRFNKMTLKYLIVLMVILSSYVILCIYIRYKYTSSLAIVPINQYMSIAIISISTILGLFIKPNKPRIIISSLPAIIMMLFLILSAFMSYVDMQCLWEDVNVALSYLLIIEVSTQIILCPIYLFNKKSN